MIPQELYIKELSKVCRHGQDIVNPYSGTHMYVPCGVCPTCLSKKASMRTIRCSVQQELSDYTYFGTLTYSTRYVPKAVITHVSDDVYSFRSLPRPKFYTKVKKGDIKSFKLVRGLSYSDDFSTTFKATSSYIDNFKRQASLNIDGKYPSLSDQVGYLSRKDFQLFMKRLRFKCQQITGKYEKIHFYVVGEYSPRHFRPHFHFLLCFDSKELASCIRQVVSSCWPFGRIDVSAAREHASSYVASYVNSSSRLPYVLNSSSGIRPFSRFSNGFGADVFLVSRAVSRRFDLPPDERFVDFVDGVPCVVGSQLFSLRPWRQVVDTCFFRPAANPRMSFYELRYLVIQVCCSLSSYFSTNPGGSCLGFAKYLYNQLYNVYDDSIRRLIFNGDYCVSDLLYYSRCEYSTCTSDVHRDLFVGQVYRLCLSVYRFVTGIGCSISHLDTSILDAHLRNSQEFFSYRDYAYLKRSLQFVEDSEDDILDMYLLPTRFSVSQFDANHPLASLSSLYSANRVEASIKHRDVNDLNIKFVNYGEI